MLLLFEFVRTEYDPEDFQKYCNEVLFVKYRVGIQWETERQWVHDRFVTHPKQLFARIGLTCATNALHRLGFIYSAARGGVFSDMHDNEGNTKYRKEVFLPKMWRILDRSYTFVSISWLAKHESWDPKHPGHLWDDYLKELTDPETIQTVKM